MPRLIKKDAPRTERPAPAPKQETPEQQANRLRKEWLKDKNQKEDDRRKEVMRWLRT